MIDPTDILTELSSLLDGLGITEKEVQQSVTGVVENMLDESHWRQLGEQSFIGLLFEGISLYGQTN